MYAQDLCRLRVDLDLVVVSPVHVGGGGAQKAGRAAPGGGVTRHFAHREVATSKGRGADYTLALEPLYRKTGDVALPLHEVDESGRVRFVIPATSLRGAARHHLWSRIDEAIGPGAMERPEPGYTRADGEDAELLRDPAARDRHFGGVLVRHLFGTTARAGALAFTPAEASGGTTGRSFYSTFASRPIGSPTDADLRVLTNNRLDRFSAASTEGLRNIAALEVGTVLSTSASIAQFCWWQAGALGLLVDAWRSGELPVGARGGAGLGRVRPVVRRVVLQYHRVVRKRMEGGWPGAGVLRPDVDPAFVTLGALDRLDPDPAWAIEEDTPDPFWFTHVLKDGDADALLVRATAHLAAAAAAQLPEEA